MSTDEEQKHIEYVNVTLNNTVDDLWVFRAAPETVLDIIEALKRVTVQREKTRQKSGFTHRKGLKNIYNTDIVLYDNKQEDFFKKKNIAYKVGTNDAEE